MSAELKTATTQVTAVKVEKQNLTVELEEIKTKLDEQIKKDQLEKDKKDNIISKLRALAKKYKGYYISLLSLNYFLHIYER